MSFFAAVNDPKLNIAWSRVIHSMSLLADHVKFVVSPKWLSISVFNNSKTSHAEVVLKEEFFDKYQTDFSGEMLDGFEEGAAADAWDECADSELPTYSFLVNAKHLSTLFKNLNASELNYNCLKVYCSEEGPTNLKYKLLVEVKTEKLIVKKFQTSIQPVTKNSLKVAESYKESLYHQEHLAIEDWSSFVRHIMIENTILKEFLEVAPSSAEDFKIEVKEGKILFTAHTPPIFKDREYLKQPMSVTMAMSSDELLNCNLNAGKELVNQSINFRLKDLKVFINLTSSMNYLMNSAYSEDGYINIGSSKFNAFEILFKSSGDPVLFKVEDDSKIIIRFVQVTTEEPRKNHTGGYIDPDTRDRKRKLEISCNKKQSTKAKSISKPQRKQKTKNNSSQNIEIQPSSVKPAVITGRLDATLKKSRNEQQIGIREIEKMSNDSQGYTSSDLHADRITYEISSAFDVLTEETAAPDVSLGGKRQGGKFSEHPKLTSLNQRRFIITDGETDHSDSEENNAELGPTQIEEKPKSILD